MIFRKKVPKEKTFGDWLAERLLLEKKIEAIDAEILILQQACTHDVYDTFDSLDGTSGYIMCMKCFAKLQRLY